MVRANLTEWLLENGGPVIRFRTRRDLLDEAAPPIDELLESPIVRGWLERLLPVTSFTGIHHGNPSALENAMGRLVDLGLAKGMSPLDEKTLPIREWLAESTPDQPFAPFTRAVVAHHLAAAGYGDEPAVGEIVRHRLELVTAFVRRRSYDVYGDPAEFRGIPKAFRGRSVIRPEIANGEDLRLPWIHDLFGFAALAPDGAEPVVRYVLDDPYYSLDDGYGILLSANGRYYAMGWDAKLMEGSGFLLRLALFGRFPAARSHPRFRAARRRLEEYRTEAGTYLFPRDMLPERQSGYFVTGAYHALEENRRPQLAIELESTFRALLVG